MDEWGCFWEHGWPSPSGDALERRARYEVRWPHHSCLVPDVWGGRVTKLVPRVTGGQWACPRNRPGPLPPLPSAPRQLQDGAVCTGGRAGKGAPVPARPEHATARAYWAQEVPDGVPRRDTPWR